MNFLLKRVETDPDTLGPEDLDIVDTDLPEGPSPVSRVGRSQFAKNMASAIYFEHAIST